MNFRINLKPIPAAPYFTVQEHVRKFSDTPDNIDHLQDIDESLKELFNIPIEFDFELIDLSKKGAYKKSFAEIIVKDDPKLGIDQLAKKSDVCPNTLLDLSYSFPQVHDTYADYEAIIIDPIASLGIPVDYFISYTKRHQENKSGNQIGGMEKEAYLLSNVLNDLSLKGMELLLRESNYKAAVLYQLMESNTNLHPLAVKEYRSKTMFVANCQLDFFSKIEKLGYELSHKTNGKSVTFTITNYPTQSKELIEMFVDRVDAL